jgi:hypothetical protein
MRKIGFTIALVASLAGGQAIADTIALTNSSGGVQATSGSDQLFGWFFDLSAPVDVTALGVGDSVGAALAVSHDVGIFAVNDEALLLSTTVPAGGGAYLDGFRYVSVSPTALPAGDYVIVMTMPEGNADTQSIENTSETTSAPVAYVDSAFDDGSSLAFPTQPGLFAIGLFGSELHLCQQRDSRTLDLGDDGSRICGSRLCRISPSAAHGLIRQSVAPHAHHLVYL